MAGQAIDAIATRMTTARDYARIGGVEGRTIIGHVRGGEEEDATLEALTRAGTGNLVVVEQADADRRRDKRTRIGVEMRMAAAGAEGIIVAPEEADTLMLRLKGDPFWVEMRSDRVQAKDGNMETTRSQASRLRLIVERSRTFEVGMGELTPATEIGLRHDAGDAETGTDIEIGASARYARPGGVPSTRPCAGS